MDCLKGSLHFPFSFLTCSNRSAWPLANLFTVTFITAYLKTLGTLVALKTWPSATHFLKKNQFPLYFQCLFSSSGYYVFACPFVSLVIYNCWVDVSFSLTFVTYKASVTWNLLTGCWLLSTPQLAAMVTSRWQKWNILYFCKTETENVKVWVKVLPYCFSQNVWKSATFSLKLFWFMLQFLQFHNNSEGRC